MTKESSGYHLPVLLDEVIRFLKVAPGGKYIDATLGGGGHAREIMERGGEVLGIDADPDSISYVNRHFPEITAVEGNFKYIKTIGKKHGFFSVQGILFDLGMSSHQLEHSGRGFSFQKEEPLDMRMSPHLKVKAEDLVTALSKKELYELFSKYAEEPHSRLYATAVVRERRLRKIATARRLAEIIERTARKKGIKRGRLHPATRVFQALRMAVNDELDALEEGLKESVSLLKSKGRLVVISFHSLEDRLVKEMRNQDELKVFSDLIRPAEEEVIRNPRASSARMRVYEKK